MQFAYINSYPATYWWATWRFEILMTLAQLFWVWRWRNSWRLSVLLLFSWLASGFTIVWQLAHNGYLPSSRPIAYWLPYFLP